MRILHTSDWHLGQNFYTKSREAEHQALIDWLVAQIEPQQIDAVILAGDVFDTGAPSSYARRLYNDLIKKVNQKDCQLIIIAGNHDSVGVLEESKDLLESLNTQVVARADGDLAKAVIEVKNKQGDCVGFVCATPFLRPRDLLKSQVGESAIQKQQAINEAIAEHYFALHQIAEQKRAAHFEQTQQWLPIVATGHLTAMGVKTSESVRDIYIGNLDGFDAKGFPDADYIALGHIHRPQIVAKQDHIRYCGAPIVLSFDEANKSKQALCIEFAPLSQKQRHTPQINSLSIPSFQPIAALKTSLSSLKHDAAELIEQMELTPEQILWLKIEIEFQGYLTDIAAKVSDELADLPAYALQIVRIKEKTEKSLTQVQKQSLSELNVTDVFAKRLQAENFSPDEAQKKERLTNAFLNIYHQVSAGLDEDDSGNAQTTATHSQLPPQAEDKA